MVRAALKVSAKLVVSAARAALVRLPVTLAPRLAILAPAPHRPMLLVQVVYHKRPHWTWSN